jgi:hypothetical protein
MKRAIFIILSVMLQMTAAMTSPSSSYIYLLDSRADAHPHQPERRALQLAGADMKCRPFGECAPCPDDEVSTAHLTPTLTLTLLCGADRLRFACPSTGCRIGV